ncbi:MAG: ATP-binding protein [Lachnospiraceae bacterium]|nr:ATP-binding protein [Lachnospiraceae bacterium]
MYSKIARLIVYKEIADADILNGIAECIYVYERGEIDNTQAVEWLYRQVHKLLDLATAYGFDENLWQAYLAYLLAMTETPFSLLCEKNGAADGSVNTLVKNDFAIIRDLFFYDFTELEKKLDITCFSVLTAYRSIPKKVQHFNKSVGDKVKELQHALAASGDADDVFDAVTGFYKKYGVGQFGLNKAFRLVGEGEDFSLQPITNTEIVRLSDIIGYDLQKKTLVENTKAFVEGRKANNVLLYGDSGTGKSTSIKAILNEFYDDGLRMIEIYKHQFHQLSALISKIKNRNYRFVIYMDDLSFEEFEIEYKYLKAVIEGGLEIRPENILIYATSNRRHLIRETWSDRSDMSKDELHRSDTMQEKLSLVARFGITINYSAPDKREFERIVKGIAAKYPELDGKEEMLLAQANIWELRGGGLSGRSAQQFIHYILGKEV